MSYGVYGLNLRSSWDLPYPPATHGPFIARVALRHGTAGRFAAARSSAKQLRTAVGWTSSPLPDGSTYLCWSNLFEFVVERDGHTVLCHPLGTHAVDALYTHLGLSLSFALINLGIEPLHSTTVMIDGAAVALMGDCGYGKSSLGAAFLRAGYPLMTDDLLAVADNGGEFVAYPGAPRIKLFPEIAAAIFGADVNGVRMPHLTPKLIIPLDGGRVRSAPAPLKAAYILTPPSRDERRRVTVRRLSPRRACLQLIRNTFNRSVVAPERLQRQLACSTKLALAVPVSMLSYPRRLDILDAARDAIIADVRRRVIQPL